jgi:hypothetical protein
MPVQALAVAASGRQLLQYHFMFSFLLIEEVYWVKLNPETYFEMIWFVPVTRLSPFKVNARHRSVLCLTTVKLKH